MRRWILFVVALLIAAPPFVEAQTDPRAAFDAAVQKAGPADLETEGGAHAYTQKLAEILTCQDPNWGRKSTNGGPISKDTLAYRMGPMTSDGRNTPMRVFDYCMSCGEPGARFGWVDHGLITNQRFLSVLCLEGGGGDDPPPPPPPDPMGKLLALLESVNSHLAEIHKFNFEQLEEQREQMGALRLAIAELKSELEKGVKIRF